MLLHLKAPDLLILPLPPGLSEGGKNLKGKKKTPPVLILSFSMNMKLVTLTSVINRYV